MLELFFGLTTVIGVILTVLFYLRTRVNPALDYEFLGSYRLGLPPDQPAKDLTVKYGDQLLKAPYLLLLRFKNTGNADVTAQAHRRPVKVMLPAFKLIDCEVQTSPKMDTPTTVVGPEGKELLVHPVDVQPREQFTLRIIADQLERTDYSKEEFLAVDVRYENQRNHPVRLGDSTNSYQRMLRRGRVSSTLGLVFAAFWIAAFMTLAHKTNDRLDARNSMISGLIRCAVGLSLEVKDAVAPATTTTSPPTTSAAPSVSLRSRVEIRDDLVALCKEQELDFVTREDFERLDQLKERATTAAPSP